MEVLDMLIYNWFRILNICALYTLYTCLHLYGNGGDLYLKKLGQAEGIKNVDSNSFIFKDKNDYIWISKINELEKCNSKDCVKYPSSIIEKNASYIQGCFFEDKESNIWFATDISIVKYDPNDDRFESLQVPSPNDSSKVITNYHLFYLDSVKQKIWFHAGNYIFNMDINTAVVQSLPFESKATRFVYQEGRNGVYDRIIGCFWIEPGVDIYTEGPNGWSKEYNDLKEWGSPAIKLGLAQTDSVSWFVSESGLLEMNRNKKKIFHLYRPKNKQTNYNHLTLLDNNKLMLCASDGLHIFDINKKKVIEKFNRENTGFTKDSYDMIFQDKDSLIYLPHDNGIDCVEYGKCNNFKFYYNKINAVAYDGINSIVKVKDGLIFSCNERLVRKIKYENKQFEEDNRYDRLVNLIPYNYVYDMSIDADGLVYLLLNNVVCVLEEYKVKVVDSLCSGSQYYYMEHIEDDICLVSGSKGIKKIIKLDEEYCVSESKHFIDTEIDYHKIFYRKNGDVFIAINVDAIRVFIKAEKVLKDILIGSDVLSFCESEFSDKIWLGTTNGLGFIDDDFIYHEVLKNDWEIGQNTVFSILEDVIGNLWVATNDGIWYYNPNEDVLRLFRASDGIACESFNKDSKVKMNDGVLAFGTTKGLLYFDPSKISIPNIKPKIQIEDFTVNDKDYNAEYRKIEESKRLKLNYGQNSIGLKPVVLDFANPEFNRLRYRLKGLEEEWKMIPSGEKIHYSSLPAGQDYLLELVGINANSIESEIQQLTINIALPIWRRWWFPLLMILGISLLIWGITNLYYRQKLKEKQIELERQEALSNQRKALADDLHDNLGNDLSEILHISDAASIGSKEKMNTALDTIAEMTIDSMTNMRFMITVLEGEDESLKGLLYSIREYTNKLLQRHKINFKVDFPESIPDEKINGNFKLNFSYLVKECLGNLVKHSQANKAKIKARFEDKNIYFSIEDNGVGFNVKNKLGKGKGLNTMEKRIAILDGRINIDSKCREGTCVEFWVPMGGQPE